MFAILNELPAQKRGRFACALSYFQRKKYMNLQSCGVDGAEFFVINIPCFLGDTQEKRGKRITRGLQEGRKLGKKILLPPVKPEFIPIAAQCGFFVYNPLDFKKVMALAAIERIKGLRLSRELTAVLFDPQGSNQDVSFFLKLADMTRSIVVYTLREQAVHFFDELMEEYGIPVIVSHERDCLEHGDIILAFAPLDEEEKSVRPCTVIVNLCPGICCERVKSIVIDDYFFNIPAHVAGCIPSGVKKVDFLGGLYELNGIQEVQYYRMTAFSAQGNIVMPDQLCAE